MTNFKIYTPENAPDKSRAILREVENNWGFVPNMLGELAESPAALRGWVELREIAENGAFTALERKVVGMTASYLNGCDYCIAAGTTIGEQEDLPREVLDALRADRPLKDKKLEQLRLFTKSVLKRMGRPDRKDVDAFRKAGYTNAQVLEVVLGISHTILGNYVNHIAETPLDRAFEANRVEDRKQAPRSTKRKTA